jgi:XTP/dITP diphosphohydrolase
MKTVCYLATGNAHKLREFEQMFAAAGLAWEIEGAGKLGGMPAVEESAEMFAGNALIKARALRARVPAGAWVLADDSGLEVAALGGAPGVWSARFAGPQAKDGENTAKLLRELAGVPAGGRAARFVCVLALIGPGGEERIFEGACGGRIGTELAGGGGFGYDPVFYPTGFENTYAELGDEEKNGISHRGRAMEKLVEWVRAARSV